MASRPVNDEQNHGGREKHSIKVYTRKGRGLKKQASITVVDATAAADHREYQQGNVTCSSTPATTTESKDEDQNGGDNNISVEASPETLADNICSDAGDKNYVEAPAHPQTLVGDDTTGSAFDNKNSIEAPPESLTLEDADTVVDKNPIEGPSQTVLEEDVNFAGVDKNPGEFPPETLAQDAVDTVVVDKKSVEASFQSLAEENVDNVIIDQNSIEAPSETLGQEDVSTVVVDKNPIEASHEILAQEDINRIHNPNQSSLHTVTQEDITVGVDKNSLGALGQTLVQGDINIVVENLTQASPCTFPEEDVSTVVVDNTFVEASRQEASRQALAQKDNNNSVVGNLIQESSRSLAQHDGNLVEEGSDGRIRINLASSTRHQKRELRKKLEDQLGLVRDLVRRIEAKEGEIIGLGNSRVLVNAVVNTGGGRIHSGLASPVAPHEVIRPPRPLNQLNISILEDNRGTNEHVEKEKRTPKANQFYRNSDFLLAKDKFPPAESNKKSKQSAKKQGGEVGHGFGPGSKVFKNCSTLLERLMKHKHGWVFNAPVDVRGLGLHDYFTIIKQPMDLGTIKSKLTKNWYKSPREFAEDVRLTFRNAMTYNPKGQDVHIMAEELLTIFEDRWAVIEADYNREMRFVSDYEMNLPTPRSRHAPMMRPPPINVRSMVDRSDWNTRPMDPQPKPVSTKASGRTPGLRKPKANEPNKRDMTYEEKQKLSINLQNLPPEKLDQIVQIVKKRNSAVNQHNDEIEVDIDSVDPETLWELERFITNFKKSLSKRKKRAERAVQARAEAEKNVQQKHITAPITEEYPREGNTAEKSIPAPLPSQAEKQNDNTSRSSSSSSSASDSSSSSSDSDSDSSSSSGSDRT